MSFNETSSKESGIDNVSSVESLTPQGNSGIIDEGLYSRQIYVLGKDAMNLMASSKILVSGLGALGVEVAKNVILGGVRSVTLQDTRLTSWNDLSSQYYLRDSDIGKNRAEMSLKQLNELNPYVTVDAVSTKLDEDLVKKFNIVVLTDVETKAELEKISEFCHSNNIKFILANTRGLFSRVFCDFGESFVINDVNGEQPISRILAGITKDPLGTVFCMNGARHGLEDGDYVTFEGIIGMTELNGCEPRKVEVLGPYSFNIGDTRQMSDYVRAGVFTQVKMPKMVNFKSLKNSIKEPEFLQIGETKMESIHSLNLGFQALDSFNERKGRFPLPANMDDSNELIQIAETLSAELGEDKKIELDQKLLKVFSWGSRGNICPMNGLIGGIVAQEVLKACTGKFHPICQWMFFDAIECLPFSLKDIESPDFTLDEADYQPNNTRYDGQVAVFGKSFQGVISNLRYFVVGAGAIGCELLKNFSMIGVGSGDQGRIVVTDMDIIKRSNLHRQFLFRQKDVGKPKSKCAAEAIQVMNPDVKIEHHENRVGSDTEQVYNDAFFENLSGVASALDNVESRMYIDRRCIFHRKPLLESGNVGTKGNVQVVIPLVTESYGSSLNLQQNFMHRSTVKSFPNAIEHTVAWAKDLFEEVFKQNVDSTSRFLTDPGFIERTLARPDAAILVLESVLECLTARPRTFGDCVQWARTLWEKHFNHTIQRVLLTFPPNLTSKNGVPFWSGAKRCPHPLFYAGQTDLANSFIFAAANLHAELYGIEQIRDKDSVADMVIAVEVPPFVPGLVGFVLRLADRQTFAEAQARIEQLIVKLGLISTNEIRINPLEFEKDDDNNLHIDFIVAASNSRAANYNIPVADRLKAKLIAGKIIPAIATTTSVVAGLVGLELYKMANSGQQPQLNRFKNGFVDLALPFLGFSKPKEAQKNKYYDNEWTLWDRFEIEGEMTVQQLLDHFKNEHELEVIMLVQGLKMIYSDVLSEQIRNERINLSIIDVVRKITGKELEPHVKSLIFEIVCNDKDGNIVDVPYVRYIVPRILTE